MLSTLFNTGKFVLKVSLQSSNGLAHLEPGQKVKTIMFKVVSGKSFHIEKISPGIAPTQGYDSHSSPNWLEWYLFQESQCCPTYILELMAIENTRVHSNDGITVDFSS